jgi:hypothetical protein
MPWSLWSDHAELLSRRWLSRRRSWTWFQLVANKEKKLKIWQLSWASSHEVDLRAPCHNYFLGGGCWEDGVELDLSSANSQKKLKSSHIMLEQVGAGARCDVVYEVGLNHVTSCVSNMSHRLKWNPDVNMWLNQDDVSIKQLYDHVVLWDVTKLVKAESLVEEVEQLLTCFAWVLKHVTTNQRKKELQGDAWFALHLLCTVLSFVLMAWLSSLALHDSSLLASHSSSDTWQAKKQTPVWRSCSVCLFSLDSLLFWLLLFVWLCDCVIVWLFDY